MKTLKEVANESKLNFTLEYFRGKDDPGNWSVANLNESSNYFIIKKKEDDEYVSHNDDNTSRFGGYSITQNKNGAAKFSKKRDAIEIINKYNLELNLMSELEVINF